MPNLPAGPELIILLIVAMLLFGSKKLPGAARSLGQSLRIFKAETKGLMDDDEDDLTTTPPARAQAQLELEAKQRDLARRQAELDAEAEKLNRGDTA
jgi:sec-independent protein translocase protein TatA